MIAGISIIIVNAYTLFLAIDTFSFDELARSDFFLWRQSLSLLSSFAFLISSFYLFNKISGKKIHLITFITCALGNSLLFTHEWTQIFFIRELAFNQPNSLLSIENQEGFSLLDISAICTLSLFVVGWIVFLISHQIISKYSKIIIIAGFFLSPILASIMDAKIAALIGSLFIGVGFIKLYLDVNNIKINYKSAT